MTNLYCRGKGLDTLTRVTYYYLLLELLLMKVNWVQTRIFGIVRVIVIITAISAASRAHATPSASCFYISRTQHVVSKRREARVGVRVSQVEKIILPDKEKLSTRWLPSRLGRTTHRCPCRSKCSSQIETWVLNLWRRLD
jgi:hypothetical protein